jgi:hypothetical protein
MFKKLLAIIGIGSAATAQTASRSAYKDEGTQLIYDLLFCDRLSAYKDNHKGDLKQPWSALFAEPPDYSAVQKIAEDNSEESRIRMLAFNLLRTGNHKVPSKLHLGTIVEVALPGGVDTLAVFSDRTARYINHSGRMVVVEAGAKFFDEEIQAVLKASAPVVAAIGPWDKERLPPPTDSNIRMTFLVSDGLYFGEGPMDLMQQDPLASPLINAATQLLLKVINESSKTGK